MPAAFGAGNRSGQTPQTGRTADRRKADVAEFRLDLQPPRVGCRSAGQFDGRIRPFAGGCDLSQPVANPLVGQQPTERQQDIGAKVACAGAQLQQARIAAAPTRIELRLGVPAARPHRAYPPAEEAPAIARVDDAHCAADLFEFRARAVAELRDHALRRKIKIRTRQHRAGPAGRQIERAAARIEPAQELRQQQSPSREGDVARRRRCGPIQRLQALEAVRVAADTENSPESRRQAGIERDRKALFAPPDIQIDVSQRQLRQRRIPILHRDHGVANRQLACGQIVERERLER